MDMRVFRSKLRHPALSTVSNDDDFENIGKWVGVARTLRRVKAIDCAWL